MWMKDRFFLFKESLWWENGDCFDIKRLLEKYDGKRNKKNRVSVKEISWVRYVGVKVEKS